MPHPWPLYDLTIRTPRLELRLPTEDELLGLLDVIDAGIHPADEMPFTHPWTRGSMLERQRRALQWHWSQRGAWTPDDWRLSLVTFVDGEPVGSQDIAAAMFSRRRGVSSGSWLGQSWQGRGLGTEMRQAMLHLAFEGLGAQFATSEYIEGNRASARVSEKVGYRPNGVDVAVVEGVPRRMQRVILERETWQGNRRDDIELLGLDACLPMFGLGD